jgi:hypothetical protein
MLAHARGKPVAVAIAAGLVVGLTYLALLQTLYYLTILRATTDTKLQKAQA